MLNIESYLSQFNNIDHVNMFRSFVYGFLIFLAGIFLIHIISKVIASALGKSKKLKIFTHDILTIFKISTSLLLILFILYSFNSNNLLIFIFIGSLAALTVWSLKDVAKSIIGGLHLLFIKLVKQGNYIEIKQLKGKVSKIHLRRTCLKTNDGKIISVPNKLFIEEEFLIQKMSSGKKQLQFNLFIEPTSKLQKIKQDIEEIIRTCQYVDLNFAIHIEFTSESQNGIPLIKINISLFSLKEEYETDIKNYVLFEFYKTFESD